MPYGHDRYPASRYPFVRPFDASFDKFHPDNEGRSRAGLYRRAFRVGCKLAVQKGLVRDGLMVEWPSQGPGMVSVLQEALSSVAAAWRKTDASPVAEFLHERQALFMTGEAIKTLPDEELYAIPHELWEAEPTLDPRIAEAERLYYDHGPHAPANAWEPMRAFMTEPKNVRRIAEMFVYSRIAPHFGKVKTGTVEIARRIVHEIADGKGMEDVLRFDPESLCEKQAPHESYLEWLLENHRRVLTVDDKEGWLRTAKSLAEDVKMVLQIPAAPQPRVIKPLSPLTYYPPI